MNLRLIVNAFLIILAIHLLLENLNFHISIGDPTEYFSNYLDNGEPDDYDPKQELLDYISGNNVHETISRNEVVKPSNYYVSNDNVPTFDSNVTDIRDHYQYNPESSASGSWGNPESSASGSWEDPTKKQFEPIEQAMDKLTQTPAHLAPDGTIKPDTWVYKNELPMNGGAVRGGVHGFDTLESDFAAFGDANAMIQSCQTKSPDDDIRMGMGQPNMQNRLTGGNL